MQSQDDNAVKKPKHYQDVCQCPHCGEGIEARYITQNFSFNDGNVLKYIFRADQKGKPVEDRLKAAEYATFSAQQAAERED